MWSLAELVAERRHLQGHLDDLRQDERDGREVGERLVQATAFAGELDDQIAARRATDLEFNWFWGLDG